MIHTLQINPLLKHTSLEVLVFNELGGLIVHDEGPQEYVLRLWHKHMNQGRKVVITDAEIGFEVKFMNSIMHDLTSDTYMIVPLPRAYTQSITVDDEDL